MNKEEIKKSRIKIPIAIVIIILLMLSFISLVTWVNDLSTYSDNHYYPELKYTIKEDNENWYILIHQVIERNNEDNIEYFSYFIKYKNNYTELRDLEELTNNKSNFVSFKDVDNNNIISDGDNLTINKLFNNSYEIESFKLFHFSPTEHTRFVILSLTRFDIGQYY